MGACVGAYVMCVGACDVCGYVCDMCGCICDVCGYMCNDGLFIGRICVWQPISFSWAVNFKC